MLTLAHVVVMVMEGLGGHMQHNQNQATSGIFPHCHCPKFFSHTELPVEVAGLEAVYWPVTPGTLGRPSPAIAAIPHTSTETSTVRHNLEH